MKLRDLERSLMVVHTKNGTSIEGFLAERRDHVSLEDPVFLDASEERKEDQRKPIRGPAIVLKDNIDWLQPGDRD